jgi:Allene oxide cyclase barrel like domain
MADRLQDQTARCRTAARAITGMAGEEGTMGKGKRLGLLGAVIAVVALVVGVVSPALGSSSQGAGSTSSGHADEQTLRVTAVFTEFDANIDVGAPGFSLGDEVVFSGKLLRNGEQVGRIGVVCTFVSTANADRVEAQCPTTSILPGGQITTQGTIVNRSLNFTLPITGGSGRYQGAGGQVVSRDVSTPTQPQVELTFQLEF